MMRCHRLLAALCFMAAGSVYAADPPAGPTPSPQGHALLVGCTAYPLLDVQQLEGPANDVVLMHDLLTKHFGFPKENIVTLSEAEGKSRGESHRPTRANVKAQFDRLAKQAADGQQVVILMAGHGGKIPVVDPTDPDNFEPDGVDELFLCADAEQVNEEKRTCAGGIVDNDLGAWVQAIADRGAHVWIVVDCCHSGTMLRGPDDVVQRRVPMEKLVSPGVLREFKQRATGAGGARGGAAAKAVEKSQLPATLKNVAAIYASQPEQSTIELPLPPDNPKRQKLGVLTYTINEVLRQARGKLTYRELAQRVQASYARAGLTEPTPFLEGLDEKREVLGLEEWPHRSTIKLIATSPEMRIDAGSLHGLTVNSILSLLPPDVADGEMPLGYVKITQLGSISATVVGTTHEGLAPADKVPEEARCDVAFLDFGLKKLRVFVDVSSPAEKGRVTSAVRTLESRSGLIQLASVRQEADWVLRSAKGQLVLEPGSGVDDVSSTPTPRFGPIPIDEQLTRWLELNLTSIARAQNLLATARDVPLLAGKKPCKAKLELVRLSDVDDKVGADPIEWQTDGIELHKDDLIGCRLSNEGEDPVDVTLLFVDAGYGIKAEFPASGSRLNRIHSVDKPFLAYRGQIDDSTTGLEHMVLIAVPGEDALPLDFSVLEQSSLPMLRGSVRGGGIAALDSPLGQLLKTAMYASGTRRGGGPKELGNHQVQVISWRVVRDQP